MRVNTPSCTRKFVNKYVYEKKTEGVKNFVETFDANGIRAIYLTKIFPWVEKISACHTYRSVRLCACVLAHV